MDKQSLFLRSTRDRRPPATSLEESDTEVEAMPQRNKRHHHLTPRRKAAKIKALVLRKFDTLALEAVARPDSADGFFRDELEALNQEEEGPAWRGIHRSLLRLGATLPQLLVNKRAVCERLVRLLDEPGRFKSASRLLIAMLRDLQHEVSPAFIEFFFPFGFKRIRMEDLPQAEELLYLLSAFLRFCTQGSGQQLPGLCGAFVGAAVASTPSNAICRALGGVLGAGLKSLSVHAAHCLLSSIYAALDGVGGDEQAWRVCFHLAASFLFELLRGTREGSGEFTLAHFTALLSQVLREGGRHEWVKTFEGRLLRFVIYKLDRHFNKGVFGQKASKSRLIDAIFAADDEIFKEDMLDVLLDLAQGNSREIFTAEVCEKVESFIQTSVFSDTRVSEFLAVFFEFTHQPLVGVGADLLVKGDALVVFLREAVCHEQAHSRDLHAFDLKKRLLCPPSSPIFPSELFELISFSLFELLKHGVEPCLEAVALLNAKTAAADKSFKFSVGSREVTAQIELFFATLAQRMAVCPTRELCLAEQLVRFLLRCEFRGEAQIAFSSFKPAIAACAQRLRTLPASGLDACFSFAAADVLRPRPQLLRLLAFADAQARERRAVTGLLNALVDFADHRLEAWQREEDAVELREAAALLGESGAFFPAKRSHCIRVTEHTVCFALVNKSEEVRLRALNTFGEHDALAAPIPASRFFGNATLGAVLTRLGAMPGDIEHEREAANVLLNLQKEVEAGRVTASQLRVVFFWAVGYLFRRFGRGKQDVQTLLLAAVARDGQLFAFFMHLLTALFLCDGSDFAEQGELGLPAATDHLDLRQFRDACGAVMGGKGALPAGQQAVMIDCLDLLQGEAAEGDRPQLVALGNCLMAAFHGKALPAEQQHRQRLESVCLWRLRREKGRQRDRDAALVLRLHPGMSPDCRALFTGLADPRGVKGKLLTLSTDAFTAEDEAVRQCLLPALLAAHFFGAPRDCPTRRVAAARQAFICEQLALLLRSPAQAVEYLAQSTGFDAAALLRGQMELKALPPTRVRAGAELLLLGVRVFRLGLDTPAKSVLRAAMRLYAFLWAARNAEGRAASVLKQARKYALETICLCFEVFIRDDLSSEAESLTQLLATQLAAPTRETSPVEGLLRFFCLYEPYKVFLLQQPVLLRRLLHGWDDRPGTLATLRHLRQLPRFGDLGDSRPADLALRLRAASGVLLGDARFAEFGGRIAAEGELLAQRFFA